MRWPIPRAGTATTAGAWCGCRRAPRARARPSRVGLPSEPARLGMLPQIGDQLRVARLEQLRHSGTTPATRASRSIAESASCPSESTACEAVRAGRGGLSSLAAVASYDVRIRLGDSSSAGVDPAKLVLKHHLADRAEVHAEALSGGHLLHLSVAGCLFNAILREARSRGIAVTDLQISAEGDFGGEPSTSTRITYSVDLAGEAPED